MSDRIFYIIAALLLLVLTSIIGVVAYILLTTPRVVSPSSTNAQAQCQTFTQTNKTVCGSFLTYWTEHGGVLRQGLPISSEFQEVSDIDRQIYTVQYFERVVLEHHPENQAPFDVLISLLGSIQYKTRYPHGVQPLEQLPAGMKPEGGAVFPQTGKDVRGIFLDYWLNNGGTLQFGYPISDAFMESSQPDGTEHIVQYFERSVFEYHPENQPPNDVQLSLLGRFRFEHKYPNGDPGLATPTPSPQPANTSVPTGTSAATSAATSRAASTATTIPTATNTPKSIPAATSTPSFSLTQTPTPLVLSQPLRRPPRLQESPTFLEPPAPSNWPTSQLLFSDGLSG